MTAPRPNFFIVGAPKCGTTSLARWLGEHPQVYMPPIKEPHYFSSDLANSAVKNKRQYERLFKDVKERHVAVGEGSTWYLYSKLAVPNIEREFSGTRYIVMTRDPVEMARSLYHHNRRVLHEDQSTFELAWRKQMKRAKGLDVPRQCTEPAFLQYKAACSLGSLLERLYRQVPADRVLHIPLERLGENPNLVYRRALEFLGLPDDGRQQFACANRARGHRSHLLQRMMVVGARARRAVGVDRGTGLGRLNEKPEEKHALSAPFRAELEEVFADERLRLTQLTG